MEKLLEVKNLTKRYKNGRGAFDINLTVHPGEIVGLLGPNGSGKTTVMKAAAGLINPTGGSVSICGFDVETELEKALANAGFLIENPALYGFMTVKQNLKLAAKYYDGCNNERINDVLRLVGLGLYQNDKTAKFSMGMKQRLHLALALLSNPKLMVLDEPFNGLDIEGVIRVREIIKAKVTQNGAACLISGHVAAELEKICTHAAVMHEGRIIAYDTVENALKTRPTLEDYYILNVRGERGGVLQ